MLRTNRKLIGDQLSQKYTYFDIIKMLKLTSKNGYLDDNEVLAIEMLYYEHREISSESLRKHISVTFARYRRLKNELGSFDKLKTFTTKEKREIFNKHRSLKLLLFHIILGRIDIDNSIDLKGFCETEEMLTSEEMNLIKVACEHYKYTPRTLRGIYKFVVRIMIVKRKTLQDINSQDIYECYRSKQDSANASFNVLKYMGSISDFEQYNINNRNSLNPPNKICLETNYEPYVLLHQKYYEYIEIQEETESNKHLTLRPVTLFLNWLSKNNINNDLSILDFVSVKNFVTWMKKEPTKIKGEPYSKNTVNAMLASFGKFLRYLITEKYVSNDFSKEYINSYDFSYQNEPTELFNDIVPSEDRRLIEKIVMEFSVYDRYPLVPDMIRLLYYCALRPIELVTLKLTCQKGTDKNPSLHVHKSKNGDERYIPLVKEAYNIVDRYKNINGNGKSIYSKYDRENERRLFAYRDRILSRSSLNNIFGRQQKKYGLVDELGRPKYDIYILRKLRITMWIESGMSIENICILAGHRDVKSQNAYYVGKEFMLENGLKSYIKLYKDFIEKLENSEGVEDEGCSYNNDNDINQETNYLVELQNTLQQMESKSIFDVATRLAYKDYPEMFFPLTDGLCGALYEEDEDFKCEIMDLPCLECNDLINPHNYIKEFDNYVLSLYNSRREYDKKGLDGLVIKNDGIIDRLISFYQKTFNLSKEHVLDRFKNIESQTIVKRGRRKKI